MTDPSTDLPTPEKKPSDDAIQFFIELESHLQTVQTDFLSEGTRKDQRLLLSIAFVLLFVSLGAIHVAAQEFKPGDWPIKVSANAPEVFTLLGLLICTYLEVTYAIRCYADWSLHAIKRGRAQFILSLAQENVVPEVPPFEQSREGLSGELPAVWNLQQKLGGSYVRNSISDEQLQLLARLRNEHASKSLLASSQHVWLLPSLRRVRTSTLLRLAFDVVFPLAFGAVAIFKAFTALH